MRFFGWNITGVDSPSIRQEGDGDYTAAVLEEFRQQVSGENAIEAAATAAVEFALGLYSRAFMSATVTPAVPALSPEYLASLIRDAILRGNHLSAIYTGPEGFRLARASGYDIQGGPNPSTWRYSMELPGPTRTDRLTRIASTSVVHVRVNAALSQPWRGVSPIVLAGITSKMLAKIEDKLSQGQNARTFSIIQYPQDGGGDDLSKVQKRIRESKGRSLMQQAGSGGIRRTGQSGRQHDWKQVRFGPEVDGGSADLRSRVASDIVSALGIPSGLLSTEQGTVSREAYRQFLTSAILPLSELIKWEINNKLGLNITMDFHKLSAADVAAKARAYKALVDAQVDPEEAARLVALRDG